MQDAKKRHFNLSGRSFRKTPWDCKELWGGPVAPDAFIRGGSRKNVASNETARVRSFRFAGRTNASAPTRAITVAEVVEFGFQAALWADPCAGQRKERWACA